MKRQALYFLSLCAVAGISFTGCDDGNSTKTCYTGRDCVVGQEYCDPQRGVCRTYLPEQCSDGKLSAGETDVDCGGICVTESPDAEHQVKCKVDQGCKVDADCRMNACTDGKCVVLGCYDDKGCASIKGLCDMTTNTCISCSDGLINGDETDVDCGGRCDKCGVERICKENSDCANNMCENGKCANVQITSGNASGLVINEVFDSSTKSPKFSLNKDGAAIEFVEIGNPTDGSVDLTGLKLSIVRIDKAATAEVELSGVLPAKNMLIVVGKGGSIELPSDARLIQSDKLSFVGTGTYELTIIADATDDSKNSTTFSVTIGSTVDSSFSRSPEFKRDGNVVKTIEISGHAAFATPGYCSNGGHSTDCISNCTNKVVDNDETDVDCGGSCPVRCDKDQTCIENKDCKSDFCKKEDAGAATGICAEKAVACTEENAEQVCGAGNKCVNGTCESSEPADLCKDNIQNQDETDVDCGGKCKACDIGMSCLDGKDCVSNECTNNVCTGEAPETFDPGRLVINELFDSGASSPAFPLNNLVKACEFIEIANPTSETANLTGLTLKLIRTDGTSAGKTTSIPLEGQLKSKNLLVLHNCDTLGLPDDAIEGKLPSSTTITGKASYDVQISSSVKDGPVTSIAFASETKSSYSRYPEFDSSSPFVKTIEQEVYGAFATPGYCTNGGKYSENCTPVSGFCGNGSESCGGFCNRCDDGKKCTVADDCKSGVCDGNVCGSGSGPVDGGSCGNGSEKCGGTCSEKCANGKSCTKATDCVSGKCEGNVCVAGGDNPTTDCGNGTETCGGTCSEKCANGKSCTKAADCVSGRCEGNVCVAGGDTPVDPNAVTRLMINEVMGSPKSGMKFALQTNTDQMEFVEIVNMNDTSMNLEGITLELHKGTELCKGSADELKKCLKQIALTDVVPANGCVVVSTSALDVPSDCINLATLGSSAITNTSDYILVLTDSNGNRSSLAHRKSWSPDGQSQNRSVDVSTSVEELIMHTDVASNDTKLANSPGYCANGKQFSKNCK